ncbi:hypothetical protein LZ554_002523 [Drepanopeziza brunnea f. sp. 'monogermtubi']|nr:hypothetical protein LZ554_002523 [Drepanopeziza brunnea f. sp. 'monogermtubi']
MICDSPPDSLLCPTDVAALADLGTITPRTPPSTPEERAFDQLPEQSLLDSKFLSSLLADLLGRGKLPVCIRANGSVFQISEVQEAADRLGCENPATLRAQEIKGTTSKDIAISRRALQRKLSEMGSDDISDLAEIRGLHEDSKTRHGFSDVFIRNLQNLLFAKTSNIEDFIRDVRQQARDEPGRVVALKNNILESTVSKNKILDFVKR